MRLRDALRAGFEAGWMPEFRAARDFLSGPLAIDAEWARELAAAAMERDRHALKALRFGWGSAVTEHEVIRGVGIVKISGALIEGSYFHDYSDIRAAVEDHVAKSGVHSILLELDSPGGSVRGLFALADRLRELRGTKPMLALANEQATSAAYVIAAQCDEVHAANSNTSIVGSIGVIATHIDWSGANEQMGLRFTEVVSGRHKNELSREQPLSREGRATLERIVEGGFVEMIGAISAGRRAMTEERIRAQEAAIYLGAEGEAAGLVDGIATRDELIERLAQKAQGRGIYVPAASTPGQEATMTDPTNPAATPAPAAPAAQPSATPAPAAAAQPAGGGQVIDLDAARAAARGEGEVAARTAARELARGVSEACTVAGMPQLAGSLLAEEGMTLELARTRIQEARLKAGGPEIQTAVDAAAGAATQPRIDTQAIYDRWNGRAAK